MHTRKVLSKFKILHQRISEEKHVVKNSGIFAQTNQVMSVDTATIKTIMFKNCL